MRLDGSDPQYRALVSDLRQKHPDPLDRILVLTAVLQREPDPILADLLAGTVQEYASWVRSCQTGSILPSAKRVLQHETQHPPGVDLETFFECYEDPDLSEF